MIKHKINLLLVVNFEARMTSERTSFAIAIFLFLPLFSQSVSLKTSRFNSSTDGNLTMQCIEFERKALLKFKEGLTDPAGQLSSWVGKDCCQWNGISCNKQTGNVFKIDLRGGDCGLFGGFADYYYNSSCLGGEISPSLLHLKYLSYLDLSMNDFKGILIPKFIGSLEKLSYLNLSQSSFWGMVPPHLGNLSNLQYLDLSDLPAFFFYPSVLVSDLNWLAGLSSLKYLNLGSANLSEAMGWLQEVNTIPALSELHLRDCQLPNFPQSLQNSNFTSLSVLDLSVNYLNASLPQWLFNISTLVNINISQNNFGGSIGNVSWENHHLQALDLSSNSISGDISGLIEGLSRSCNNSLKVLKLEFNKFSGQLPDSLANFQPLRSLLLNKNLISGPIPESVGKLLFLKELDLAFNEMNGSIPGSVGKLAEVSNLQLYQNSWKGVLSQDLLQGLTKLEGFSVSSDKTFVFDVRHDWVPPFSLRSIRVSNIPLGPVFPGWLRTQKELSSIVLTNVSILDKIPDWLWEMSMQIDTLDLSHNQIFGVLPSLLKFSYKVDLDLSFNCLEGPIPLWPNVTTLFLGHNLFSGPIPINIGQVMSSLLALDLSGNSLNGSIPLSVSKLNRLIALDLSNNHLSGKIPSHWEDLQLFNIDLSWNNLSGHVPDSICLVLFLRWLKLNGNNLSGELSWLQNCTSLSSLDLGDNRFTGKIPEWFGESLPSLSALRVRANLFTGNIPQQLCRLPDLHILDLADNNLIGSIPSCLGNLRGFSSLTSYSQLPPALPSFCTYEMDLVVKGTQYSYTHTLELVNIMDLSSNNLSGEIPNEITKLSTLGTLNLSRNELTGKIPEKIGDLRRIETLDLSNNRFSGLIPPSMASITSLSHLNLSYNNLSGPIPSTNQFHTFNDPSIYEGNPELCGLPLSTKCPTSTPEHKVKDDNEHESDYDNLWFYLSMGAGFIVGFWAVCGSLTLKRSWRLAYFQFVDEVGDWLFVKIAVNVAHIRRTMETKRN